MKAVKAPALKRALTQILGRAFEERERLAAAIEGRTFRRGSITDRDTLRELGAVEDRIVRVAEALNLTPGAETATDKLDELVNAALLARYAAPSE